MTRPSAAVVAIAMLLAGCGSDTGDVPDAAGSEASRTDEPQTSEDEPEPDDEASQDAEQQAGDRSEGDDLEDLGEVEVERNLLSVSVTLPASLLEGQDLDQAIADAEADGMRDVTANEDGSLTYRMSRSEHREVMEEMRATAVSSTEEMISEYESIKDITYDDALSEFTVVVDRAAYESTFDGFAVLGIWMLGAYYQLFDGADMDDYQVEIHTQDAATGEVYDTSLMPEDFDA